MLSTKNYIFPSWWLRKITKQPTVNNPQQRLLKLNICHPDKWNYRHLTTSTLHSPVHTIDVDLAVATLRSGLWLSLINIHDVYGPHYTVPLRHGHGAIKLSTTPTRSLLYIEGPFENKFGGIRSLRGGRYPFVNSLRAGSRAFVNTCSDRLEHALNARSRDCERLDLRGNDFVFIMDKCYKWNTTG